MKTIGWDTETHLVKPGCGAPKLVCVSYAASGERGSGTLLNREDGLAWVEEQLRDPEVRLVAHHAPFDLGVICAERFDLIDLVFKAIDEDRLVCTLLRQKIIDNALGELKFLWDDELEQYKRQRYGLEYVAMRHLRRKREKGGDTFRLRYRELDGVPISEYPEEALNYAIWDAEDAMALYEYQHAQEPNIIGERWQMEAAWALHLASLWGLRTEPTRVTKIEEKFEAAWLKQVKICQDHGFMRENRSKDTKAIGSALKSWMKEHGQEWIEKHGEDALETPTGKISLKREILLATDHEGLRAVAEAGKWAKKLTTYLPILKAGTEFPICCSYNAILETFRTSCRAPNVQNFPRKGGIRECFVARTGWLYLFCDYDTLELRALAQILLWLFGQSCMAEALHEGKDLHLDMAAQILGISYEEALTRLDAGDEEVTDMRQRSKPANFGFPGGMGARAFVEYAAQYGVIITEERAQELHDMFMEQWPEMAQYFEYCAGLAYKGNAEVIEFFVSGMLRGDVPYTAACNGFFQNLAAMGAKQALYKASKECYTDKNSPLYGCRVVAFLHDELALEVPDNEQAHDAASRLQELMIEAMAEWIPDIPITCGPVLTRTWYKGAKPVLENGRLVPSKPDGKKWVRDSLAA